MATRKKADPPKSEEAVAVEATIIEKDVAKISDFGFWLGKMQVKASAMASKHHPEPIADEAGYAEAKKARTEVRRLRDDIDSARKAQLREVEDALKALKQQVKDVIAPLDELDAQYKRLLDEYDKARAYERGLELAKAYEDMAPALADMLPYFRLAELADPEGRWLLRTVDDKKARELMEDAAGKAVQGYEAIGAMGLEDEDATAIRAEYFRTLDLAAAMARATELKAERERIAAFEAERRAAEAEAEAERIDAYAATHSDDEVAEQIAREAVGAAMGAPIEVHPPVHASEAQSWATGAEPNPRPQVETSSQATLAAEVAHAATMPPGEDVPPIALVAYCTEAQRSGLVQYCKANGIRGFFRATHGRRIEIVERS